MNDRVVAVSGAGGDRGDRGCGEELGHHTRRGEPTDADGLADRREPRRGRHHGCARGHGTCPSARDPARRHGGHRAGATSQAAHGRGATNGRHSAHGRRPTDGRAAATGARGRGAAASAGRDRAAASTTGGRHGAAAMEYGPEDRRLEPDGERHRQDEGEGRALVADLALEGLAAGTTIDMGAQKAARRDAPLHHRELLADIAARMLPGGPAPHQRLARLEDERLDLLGPDSQHGGDVLLRVVSELEEDKRGALIGGQALHVIEHLAQVLTALDLVGEALESRMISGELVDADRLAAGAQLRQAPVARDRVQPGPQRDAVRAMAQGAIRRDERQLQRVLGGLTATEHVGAERQDAPRVPVVDLLERRGIACPHARDQLIV